MLLDNRLVNYYSLENSWRVFGQYSENLKINKKPFGKWFWTNFVKNNFSENWRQILGECSNDDEWGMTMPIFSFLPDSKLFINRIARAVPWNTKPSFFKHVFKLVFKARSVLQNLGLSISWYGTCIRLINGKNWWWNEAVFCTKG